VEREQMLGIFARDMFEWEGAASGLRALLGMDRAKPFECVGTRDETLAAIYISTERMKQQGLALPAALREIEKTVLANRRDLPQLAEEILTSWGEEHHVPPELAALLRRFSRYS
jgi:hypothetical protein